jgi:Sec-independent protein translocase protein TatA
MVNLLIGLLVLLLIVYVAFLILGACNLPEPVRGIATLILGIVFFLVLLRYLGFV